MSHTPEPWPEDFAAHDSPLRRCMVKADRVPVEDWRRAVKCVNAMARKDPEQVALDAKRYRWFREKLSTGHDSYIAQWFTDEKKMDDYVDKRMEEK